MAGETSQFCIGVSARPAPELQSAGRIPAGSTDSKKRGVRELIISFLAIGLLAGAAAVVLRTFFAESVQQLTALVTVNPSPKFVVHARPGEAVNAIFSVRNNTPHRLTIYGANTTCGCTVVANQFPIVLQPKGEVQILIRMSVPAGHHGTSHTQSAILLMDSEGTVPPLTVEALIQDPR